MINRRKLRQLVEGKGPDAAVQTLGTGLREGHYRARDFSLRDLAESLVLGPDGKPVGSEWVRSLGPQKSGGFTLMESGASGIDLSRFSNITGQIFYNSVMEGYQQEEFIAPSLVDEYQTDLNGEKIPGVTGYVDREDMEVHEAMPFPQMGFGEDYIETPATTKRGFIVSVNKETIFFDRTNLVLQQAGKVGEVLARRKEKLLWDVILGFTNNYKWSGTSYNTYLTAGAWINKLTGVTVSDWNDVDTAEQLFVDMLDPHTGEPIVISPNTILAMPAKKHLWRRILGATEVITDPGAAAGDAFKTANPLDNYNLQVSKFAYRRLLYQGVSAANAKNYWFFGDFKKAFAWQYNWPITVVQAPSNDEPEFTQDIVLRWKASERGSAVVKDPRYVAQIINA